MRRAKDQMKMSKIRLGGHEDAKDLPIASLRLAT